VRSTSTSSAESVKLIGIVFAFITPHLAASHIRRARRSTHLA
jgi:hypothetical protein